VVIRLRTFFVVAAVLVWNDNAMTLRMRGMANEVTNGLRKKGGTESGNQTVMREIESWIPMIESDTGVPFHLIVAGFGVVENVVSPVVLVDECHTRNQRYQSEFVG
jgi:hypothetical protein